MKQSCSINGAVVKLLNIESEKNTNRNTFAYKNLEEILVGLD